MTEGGLAIFDLGLRIWGILVLWSFMADDVYIVLKTMSLLNGEGGEARIVNNEYALLKTLCGTPDNHQVVS